MAQLDGAFGPTRRCVWANSTSLGGEGGGLERVELLAGVDGDVLEGGDRVAAAGEADVEVAVVRDSGDVKGLAVEQQRDRVELLERAAVEVALLGRSGD